MTQIDNRPLLSQAFFFVLLQGLLTFPERQTDPPSTYPSLNCQIVSRILNCFAWIFCRVSSIFLGVPKKIVPKGPTFFPATRCQFHPSLPQPGPQGSLAGCGLPELPRSTLWSHFVLVLSSGVLTAGGTWGGGGNGWGEGQGTWGGETDIEEFRDF